MEQKLESYIENLFSSAPRTQQASELKEEITRNTIDRYHDLLSEGKSAEEAYRLAVAGIGNINELLAELGGSVSAQPAFDQNELYEYNTARSTRRGIAIALYILCVVPCIALSATPLVDISPMFMFFMISTATALFVYNGKTKNLPMIADESISAKIKRTAAAHALAIGLYISCATPCILLAETPLVDISPAFMFVFIAAATVLLALNRSPKVNSTPFDAKQTAVYQKRPLSPAYCLITAALWIAASCAFILISVFAKPAMILVSWMVFPIAGALQALCRALFDFKEADK